MPDSTCRKVGAFWEPSVVLVELAASYKNEVIGGSQKIERTKWSEKYSKSLALN